MPDPKSRPVGRPRTKPAGVRKRAYYTTDAEHATVSAAADAAGVSAEEFARRAVLAAAHRLILRE